MFSLSKPKPKFETPTWPKLRETNTEDPKKNEVEKFREELKKLEEEKLREELKKSEVEKLREELKKSEVEKLREEVPANVEGSREFNEANDKEPEVDSAGFTQDDRLKDQSDIEFKQFQQIEPLKNNRFLITFEDVNVPQYFFRNYEMYNEGEKMIFITEFLESVTYTFNPKDFFKINRVKLEYLDPIGETAGGMIFNVKGSNFSKKGDYSDDSIQTTQLRFVVDIDSIDTLFEY
jgi:hypothetical protein